jgi:hypothetical protein
MATSSAIPEIPDAPAWSITLNAALKRPNPSAENGGIPRFPRGLLKVTGCPIWVQNIAPTSQAKSGVYSATSHDNCRLACYLLGLCAEASN